MKKNIALSIVIITSSFASQVYAAGGQSSEIKQSIESVPCDNVEYPVAISVHPYSEDAGTSIALNKNVKNTLTATNTKSSTDSVSDTYSHKATFTFGFEPKIGDATLKGSIAYEYNHVKQVSNNDTVSFAQAQQISLTSKVDGMTATPTYFKNQIWGAYYKCDSNTKKPIKVSCDKALELDVVVAQGWVFKCSKNSTGECKSGTDYSSN